jgi:Flp pilus assembly protein TadD
LSQFVESPEERSVTASAVAVYLLAPALLLGTLTARMAELIPFWVIGAAAASALVAMAVISPRLQGVQAFALFALRSPAENVRQAMLRACADVSYYLMLGFGAYVVLHWTATSLPLGLQVTVFIFGASLTAILALLLSAGRGRDWAIRIWVQNYGWYSPLGALLAVAIVSTSLFASIGYVLARRGWIDVHSLGGGTPAVDQFARYLVWHFLNAVPLLDVNKTLNWNPPLTYKGVPAGVLILGYKAALIIPVIGTIRRYWSKQEQDRQRTSLQGGGGRPERVNEADRVRWYRKAADTGDTEAMYSMGVVLAEQGRTKEAEDWFRKAAEGGESLAMYSLGLLLERQGRTEEAERWFRAGAGAGDPDAMFRLGVCLLGQGKAEEAEQWYRAGAGTGQPDAAQNLGVLLAQKGNFEEAEYWDLESAKTGNVDAAYNLGVHLALQGKIQEAEYWLRQAGGAGQIAAMHDLGSLLIKNGKLMRGLRWSLKAVVHEFKNRAPLA